MPVQGEEKEMLARDKDVVRAFEKPAFWTSGAIVAILNGGNHCVRSYRGEFVFKRDCVRLEGLLGTGDETIWIVIKFRSQS
jgi:hypothetical protein